MSALGTYQIVVCICVLLRVLHLWGKLGLEWGSRLSDKQAHGTQYTSEHNTQVVGVLILFHSTLGDDCLHEHPGILTMNSLALAQHQLEKLLWIDSLHYVTNNTSVPCIHKLCAIILASFPGFVKFTGVQRSSLAIVARAQRRSWRRGYHIIHLQTRPAQ